MRSDDSDRRQDRRSTIFDLDAQKMFIFDSRKKEADVWDMAEFCNRSVQASVDAENIKASIKPNGQTKAVRLAHRQRL